MKISKKRQIFLIFWTAIRLLAVGLLWWHRLFGYLINIFLDSVDGDILERLKMKRDSYSQWDKWLDLWLYIFIAIFVYFNFPRDLIWTTLLILFFYRLIGSILFFISKKEWLLFIFPNIFSEFFLLYLLFPNFVRTKFILAIVGLIIFCLLKEWQIHLAKIDITDLLTGKKKKWQ